MSVEESTIMAEFTVSYVVYNEVKQCEECHVSQSKDYEFMVLSCGCGCGCKERFKICSTCSLMYIECLCGCKSCYKLCSTRSTGGNLSVRRRKIFLSVCVSRVW